MPKYENKCPVHNELDLYNHCSFDCIYCISQTKDLNINFNLNEEISKISALKSDSNPFYLSPWTDCYQNEEEQNGYTRKVLLELSSRNIPFFVITKSPLVLRDIDLFKNKDNAFIAISLNSLNDDLTKQLEPGASSATERKNLIEELVQMKDVKTVIKIDPIIPGITDKDELDVLTDWLCRLKPTAVTVETLRISSRILLNMEKHLPTNLIKSMMQHYPELSETPAHPFIDYRLKILKETAAKFEKVGIKASFCKASLPERITEFDCRGGYDYDF
jgi:DNA repair photolyase